MNIEEQQDNKQINHSYRNEAGNHFFMKSSTAAVITFLSLIMMAILASIGLINLFDLLVFGNEPLTISNIENNRNVFNLGVGAYFGILVLDLLLAWTFYIIYRNINQRTSRLVGGSRILYSLINGIALTFLVMLQIDAYHIITLIAYVFFITHIFLLGYGVMQSDFIHDWMGFWLYIGGFSYIILQYGEFFISEKVFDIFMNIALIPASIVELSFAIYLVIIRKRIVKSH